MKEKIDNLKKENLTLKKLIRDVNGQENKEITYDGYFLNNYDYLRRGIL